MHIKVHHHAYLRIRDRSTYIYMYDEYKTIRAVNDASTEVRW